MKNNRREFIRRCGMATLAAGAFSLSRPGPDFDPGNHGNRISFLSPVDGDMLCEYDGKVSNGSLTTSIKVKAPGDSKVKVNGIKAKYEDGIFVADVSLNNYENTVGLEEEKSGYKESIRIFWLRNFANRYRLSLDDNIWFLRDISGNSYKYRSIFENPLLGFLKQVHDSYGTRIHMNLYYETDGFDLSRMTDKYKSEWKENANWLRLSFHALADKPDKPYINADYLKVKTDCEKVMDQVRRFAGEEVTGPVTTLHWGEATVEGCRALRDCGFKCLPCDFNVDNNLAPCSYYLDVEKRRHINKRLIWRDNREGIIFVRCTIIIDTHKLENIVPFLDDVRKDPHRSAYVDLLVHEQYFYPFYQAYQANYRQKVLTAVKWAVDNGYKPAFLEDCVF
jgi:hypothetical protein